MPRRMVSRWLPCSWWPDLSGRTGPHECGHYERRQQNNIASHDQLRFHVHAWTLVFMIATMRLQEGSWRAAVVSPRVSILAAECSFCNRADSAGLRPPLAITFLDMRTKCKELVMR